MRLVQLQNSSNERRISLVEDDRLRLIERFPSIYALAEEAIKSAGSLASTISRNLTAETLSYDKVYKNLNGWRILPSIDHPEEPTRCLVSGTGLTHKASADNRQAMHENNAALTDSMRMYQWGIAGGRPPAGEIGVAPEWFYKGSGTILRGHHEPLVVPSYAEDGGEEPELAGVYVIDASGFPLRLGMTIGNEFSDHRLEQRNYLYLASSKLGNCSIGPELVINPDYSSVRGVVSIERGEACAWSKDILTGDKAMCHSLANIEHHHFKYEAHRRPGDIHVHFLGASAFSFGDGFELQDGDVMQVSFSGFGRPLRNPISRDNSSEGLVKVPQL
jgi:hypothetical protein